MKRVKGSVIPNKGLIDRLFKVKLENRYKPMWVYYRYLDDSPFYCWQDLVYMKGLLGYSMRWVRHKKAELKRYVEWKEF